MTTLGVMFKIPLLEAVSSVSVMEMLAEQAEINVTNAVSDAYKPDSVKESEYEDLILDEYGDEYSILRTYYLCGSCIGFDQDEVRSDYIHLITQLTRRSAFLTIFGLFEYRMGKCLTLMNELSSYTGRLKGGTIEKAHEILVNIMGGTGIADVDHLTVLRNIMAHNNGTAERYKELCYSESKKTDAEKRLLKAIKRAERENAGVSVNYSNGILLNETFLRYVVTDIKRYVESMKLTVDDYNKIY